MSRHLIDSAIDWIAYCSALCIAAAAIVTGVDIVLRHSIGSSVNGLIDIVQLAMMHAVFLAIAYAFARRAHVAVTLFSDALPPGVNKILAAAWWLLGSVLFALFAVAAYGQAKMAFEYGDVSQNIRIPMIFYWLPVIMGLALSSLGALWSTITVLKDDE